MAEIYELDPADDYKYFETDWIQNDGRGNINVDYEKFLNNERGQLRSKVKGQLSNFKNSLFDNVIRPFSGDIKTNFISDFFELNKVLEEAIENAPSGPAVDVKTISVAENLRSNSVEGYKQTLISQAFDKKLLPDGPIEVAYYDSNNKYTPKESWVVTNTGSGAEIVHTETGLKFKLNRDGLSYVDDNNFKIENKKVNYESLFDPLKDFKGPAYDAQTMDRDIPNEIDEEYAESLKDKPITDGNISDMDDIDRPIFEEIETKNNIPKGSISKLGLALDPIAEGLEFALKGFGLGSIANWWVRAEAANFLAGLIRGAGAASGIAQLGQSQALMGEEFTADADAIKNAFAQNLGNQMKLSPSLWLENKYAESSLGKGKTPTEQGYYWAKDALGFGK
jgi:hypothetical protein